MKIKNLINRLKSRRGESFVDMAVMTFVVVLLLNLILSVLPIIMIKMQMNNLVSEIAREAELAGSVGTEVYTRIERLTEGLSFEPVIEISPNSGNVQLGQEITVTVTTVADISFGFFGAQDITLVSKALGISEVYWK